MKKEKQTKANAAVSGAAHPDHAGRVEAQLAQAQALAAILGAVLAFLILSTLARISRSVKKDPPQK